MVLSTLAVLRAYWTKSGSELGNVSRHRAEATAKSPTRCTRRQVRMPKVREPSSVPAVDRLAVPVHDA